MTDMSPPNSPQSHDAAYARELEAALKEACDEWQAWMDDYVEGMPDRPTDDDWRALDRIRGVLRTGLNV